MMSAAIIDATDSGADIISFSYATSSADITDAIAYAMRHDVIVVAALNNQDSEDIFESLEGHPAGNNGVIGVGAFGPGGDVMLAIDGEPATSRSTGSTATRPR
jgi:hypothetical protein